MDSANLERTYLNAVQDDGGSPSTPPNQPARREGGSVQLGNQPKIIEISSLTLKSLKEGVGKMPDLLKELKRQTGTTKKVEAALCINTSEFVLTFHNEEGEKATENVWSRLQGEGKTKFEVREGKVDQMTFTLELLHLEFPFPYVESALHKFIKKTKADREMIFENVMSLFVKNTNERYKKRVERKLYYAPNL